MIPYTIINIKCLAKLQRLIILRNMTFIGKQLKICTFSSFYVAFDLFLGGGFGFPAIILIKDMDQQKVVNQ
jgi:hypothetical protein